MKSFSEIVNPKPTPSHIRRYRISIHCDETRESYEVGFSAPLGTDQITVTALAQECLAKILGKMHMGFVR
jgi:hypothetical protein